MQPANFWHLRAALDFVIRRAASAGYKIEDDMKEVNLFLD
jgi:hypothetical protein